MPPKKRNRISEITADVDVTFQKIEEMLEEVEVDDLLNRRAHLMCYLYLKYGSRDVDRILRTMAKVPKILPSKLFSDICESHCQVQDEALPRLFSLLKDEYGATIETPSEDLCVVSPPTAVCLMGCKDRYGERKKLEVHHKLSQIRYLSFAGISVKQKCCLRCKLCRTNYNVNMFGDKTNGFKLYDDRRDFIEASDEYLVDRNVFNLQWALAQHCWVSFEGFAESLSDGFGMLNGSQDLIDRKLVANCFWWGELEEELREEKKDVFFNRNDRELCMRKIETDRCKSLYHHAAIDCTEECKARGCGKLWVTDGLWKLQFAHCMFHKQNTVDGVPLINFPDVCTEAPEPGSAFCPDHFKLMEKSKIPTSLKGFLKYAGVIRESAVIDEDIENQPLSEDAQSKISRVFCNLKTAPNQGQSVIETQGGLEFVSDQSKSIPEISSACAPDVQRDNTCTKDLGERRVLRKLSRGHQFVIRGGGHIDMWTPLYRSESMGQVFIFILSWLYLTVRNIPKAMWGGLFLAYDNMCNLKKLRAANCKLPLPKPFDKMWKKINKIIDCLHIANHKNPECQSVLHPDRFNEMYPDLTNKNTMAAEQTFSWLSRFKKIVCAMSKTHHLFYLHRLVKRRNQYVTQCYRKGRRPLLPKRRHCKST